MAVCSRDPSHVYPGHNRTCPWCAAAATATPAPKQVALVPIAAPSPQRPIPASAAPAPPLTRAGELGGKSRRKRWRAPLIIALVIALVAYPIVWAMWAAGIGAAVRAMAGFAPDWISDESIITPYEYVIEGNDRLLGGAVAGLVCAMVIGIVLCFWRRLIGAAVGIALIGASLLAFGVGYQNLAPTTEAYIMSGACNGGAGSSAQQEIDGRLVTYAIVADCRGLAVWEGVELLKFTPSPTEGELDLHLSSVTTASGAHYAAAQTVSSAGSPYQVVIWALSGDEEPWVVDVVAPPRWMGVLDAAEGHLLIERQIDGIGVLSGFDVESHTYLWSVGCPDGWNYLTGWGDLTCTERSDNSGDGLLRTYRVDTVAGALGEMIEEREW